MKEGSVIVDVAVDQGGCIETCRPTTHADPTFVVDGVVHYCVANMPGAVPRTSTFGLTNATGPWAKKLAAMGAAKAARDPVLGTAANVLNGTCTHQGVAEAFGIPWSAPDKVL
jgi:alanine dehydrogenase